MRTSKNKLTQIILDLIYLEQDMFNDGHINRETIKQLNTTIENLRYYRQFLPNEKEGK